MKYTLSIGGKRYDFYVAHIAKYKYYAIVGNRKVYFGDRNYEQYHDRLGHYRHLDHNDKKRRASYRKRHGAQGYQKNIGSPAFFAWHVLW